MRELSGVIRGDSRSTSLLPDLKTSGGLFPWVSAALQVLIVVLIEPDSGCRSVCAAGLLCNVVVRLLIGKEAARLGGKSQALRGLGMPSLVT